MHVHALTHAVPLLRTMRQWSSNGSSASSVGHRANYNKEKGAPALTSLNLLKNDLSIEAVEKLIDVFKHRPQVEVKVKVSARPYARYPDSGSASQPWHEADDTALRCHRSGRFAALRRTRRVPASQGTG